MNIDLVQFGSGSGNDHEVVLKAPFKAKDEFEVPFDQLIYSLFVREDPESDEKEDPFPKEEKDEKYHIIQKEENGAEFNDENDLEKIQNQVNPGDKVLIMDHDRFLND